VVTESWPNDVTTRRFTAPTEYAREEHAIRPIVKERGKSAKRRPNEREPKSFDGGWSPRGCANVSRRTECRNERRKRAEKTNATTTSAEKNDDD